MAASGRVIAGRAGASEDPIGGSLELSEGRDEPVSREHETFGNADLGYWNDTNTQETVIRMLSNSTKAVRSSA